ncbi:MAG: fumarate hydratase, partial [Anaerolineaceae bacterium]|nr:fumarate hydratase [Anaerolineaceae bacterium]
MIDVRVVQEKVREAVQTINFMTPENHLSHINLMLNNEQSPSGKQALTDILENRRIAMDQKVPMCQDTGVALIFVELGQDVRLSGGLLSSAIIEGVRQGYQEGFLRKSVVAEPLFERSNTRDNTPPVIYYDLVPGETLKISVAAKGFGAENMSRVVMLTPA